MKKPITDRIAELKARKEKLAAKLGTLETKARSDTRKRDTRRKIIVGAAVLAQMDKDPLLARTIARLLAASVGRLNDRAAIADLLDPAHRPAANASPEIVAEFQRQA